MDGNEALLRVIDTLDERDVPYMIVGSYSSNAYGIDRSTADADLVIDLGDQSLGSTLSPLTSVIKLDPQMSFEGATMTRRYVADVVGVPFRIEFFLVGDDPFDQVRFRRRRLGKLLGREVWLPTPEDVVLVKLRWYAALRRHKDRDDATDVMAVQGRRLDWGYVEDWADRLAIRPILDEIRAKLPADLEEATGEG